ncbi:DUF2800 domain-containing protein [uncultured Dialister sp.]|uniref:DUF2800 domain-containing protein n=1 Tax=uncultured Dialister sp. TaxID=278064 RepID=UPI0025922053|nr:DUF2800 domain-containing protein [uncultured Dialister sp.]
MGAHAILSASASHRWLKCLPSARWEQQFPDKTSAYAEEGTRAHALAEKTLKTFRNGGSPEVVSDDAEMKEAIQSYVDTVVEKYTEARQASPDARLLIEQHLDFSKWVPQGFGTGDCLIISDKILEVCDLKYGKGVEVSAQGNSQMRLYALGAIEAQEMFWGFDKVRMTIIQPRIGNVSSEEMSVEDLKTWGREAHKKALLAFEGKGEPVAGDHCRFCRCRTVCRTYADYMTAPLKEAFKMPQELQPDEISEIVLKAKKIKNWLEDIETYALVQAMDGKKLPGLKLVAGRSVRKIINPDLAAGKLLEAGYKPEEIYKPQSLQTMTELKKLCGAKKLESLLEGNMETTKRSPALVPESDKRPELSINRTEEIKSVFEKGE